MAVCTAAASVIPPDHILKMAIGYDKTLVAHLSNPDDWIAQVMTHAQARDPSLPTRMNMQVGFYTNFEN